MKIYDKITYFKVPAFFHLYETGFTQEESVKFSHSIYFDDFVNKQLGGDYLEHFPEWVWNL